MADLLPPSHEAYPADNAPMPIEHEGGYVTTDHITTESIEKSEEEAKEAAAAVARTLIEEQEKQSRDELPEDPEVDVSPGK